MGSSKSRNVKALGGATLRAVRRLDLAKALEWASRLGYAARGVVYLGLGGSSCWRRSI
ncbi:hypothetical protein [Caulobacter sp. DWR1-3-2b1]|uniref:hypothetical protein n=1 Tax=Caulobacter sp. DWR1-3-2b1 TaxID=2804670 RepID=UPI003CE8015F